MAEVMGRRLNGWIDKKLGLSEFEFGDIRTVCIWEVREIRNLGKMSSSRISLDL